jgi:protein required for attachment to host cells
MNVRIVVADERKAMFFDSSKPSDLQACGAVENPAAGLKDLDLEADRPGRRFGSPMSSGGNGVGSHSSHHHGVNGERSAQRHELVMFAKEVGQRIDADRLGRKFDRLVLVAPPKMLGLLRQSLPTQSQSLLASEIPKDLAHHSPVAIMNAIPRDTFWT